MSRIFLEKNVIDSIGPKSKGTILRSMAIFTAIELCGSFLTGERGMGWTKKNFLKFCKSKYMPKGYHKVSKLFYSIFRNGVAHHYIPKGAALLSSIKKAKSLHLVFLDKGLFIYVPQLAEDVTEAIRKFVKDLKKDSNLQSNYYKVISSLSREGKKEYREFVDSHGIKTKKIVIRGDMIVEL